jgi:hypothetical protein
MFLHNSGETPQTAARTYFIYVQLKQHYYVLRDPFPEIRNYVRLKLQDHFSATNWNVVSY